MQFNQTDETSPCLTDRYGTTLDQYSYTYDSIGNLSAETSNRGTTTYSYDGNGRIISVIEPDGKNTEYSYDASGNRAIKKEGYIGTGQAITSYTYDTSNMYIPTAEYHLHGHLEPVSRDK